MKLCIARIMTLAFAVLASANIALATPVEQNQSLDAAYEAALDLQYFGKDDEANGIFARGCDQNHAPSCNSLALSYAYGFGFKRDREKSFEIYSKSCSLKNGIGCYSVAWAYQNGEGIDKSKENANKFMALGCDFGDGQSCFEMVYEETPDGKAKSPKENLPIFVKSCEMEYSFACNLAGLIYRNGESGVTIDKAKAVSLFKTGCEQDDAQSCILAGSTLKENADKSYLVYYQKACELDDEDGCVLYNRNANIPPPKAYKSKPFQVLGIAQIGAQLYVSLEQGEVP